MNDFMTFTKGERVAIIILAAMILILIAANFFVANRPSDVKENLHDLDSIIALHERSQQDYETTRQQVLNSKTKDKKLKPKEFLGKQNDMTPNRQVIESPRHEYAKGKKSESKSKVIVNLNSADTTKFISLPGIGSYFARNIVSYREKLGGFIDIHQLLEVYAFDSARLETIKPHIIIDSIEIRKVRINHDDFKTILLHPYIEYEDVKKIINYRESKGMIKNWETYLKVVGRNDIDERLKRYLEF